MWLMNGIIKISKTIDSRARDTMYKLPFFFPMLFGDAFSLENM
jgi:hypothetical protein